MACSAGMTAGIGQSFELHVDVVYHVQAVMEQGLKGLKNSVLAENLTFRSHCVVCNGSGPK